MIFAEIDGSGCPTAFYDDRVHSAIPAAAIKIPEADWQAHLSGNLRAWDGTAWVPYSPPFDAALAAENQKQAINAACAAEITAGFTSSALGTPHVYDSTLEDQINLLGAAMSGQDLPFTCTDPATGVKAEVLHTSAQLQQVYADGVSFKSGLLSKARTLKTQLNQLAADPATTQADIDAVVW
ncbi:MAG: hypothetical protein D6717_00395 [Gammaproteobacteria bacterium]|nr:MAG: hypothetical protein D6717_00395 [Gammaproteobacteria bacterium]